jgi:urease subunit alpha
MADLVLWDPAFFGIRPSAVIKGGAIVCAPLGAVNADIPTPQPVFMRAGLPATTGSAPHLAPSFVAPAALEDGLADRLGLSRRLTAVRPTRGVTKADMPNNTALPALEVDPETFAITIDGDLVRPQPVSEVPLAQRYTMF